MFPFHISLCRFANREAVAEGPRRRRRRSAKAKSTIDRNGISILETLNDHVLQKSLLYIAIDEISANVPGAHEPAAGRLVEAEWPEPWVLALCEAGQHIAIVRFQNCPT